MKVTTYGLACAASVGLALATTAPASAERARFHYVPVDERGNMVLRVDGETGGLGDRLSWFSTVRDPDNRPPRPNWLVTFRHPCTGRTVIVPLRLPEGTPNMGYGPNRVVYNYGSYTVSIQFLADGSVYVFYNAGFFRAL